ncbi:hypothetical protein H2O73_00770 [Vibrio sp. 404]|uniref:Uncharacterized protein n=1 Tax=Vibrio marinisediminis TaxID=2758441 RepID=A0A7W2FMK5_9VIBR|nr:hypothetical protein [Vibrio marinisediminis]MBA5760858.1 hypothetical protein [Vibrio marinisediminis]
MTFSKFLTKTSMENWSSDNHKFITFWNEVRGKEDKIKKLMEDEFNKQDVFRKAIKDSLGTEYSDQKANAECWVLILKQKYTIMDAWSFMFNAMIAIFGIAVTAFTILSIYFDKDRPILLLSFFIIFAIFLLVAKFGVDKRSSWYKQLSFYLDSIAKVENL